MKDLMHIGLIDRLCNYCKHLRKGKTIVGDLCDKNPLFVPYVLECKWFEPKV